MSKHVSSSDHLQELIDAHGILDILGIPRTEASNFEYRGLEFSLTGRIEELAGRMPTEPYWTCAECGSTRNVRQLVYDTPGEPREHDLECCKCGSTDIRESPEEVLSKFYHQIDSLRVALEMLGKVKQASMEGWLGPDTYYRDLNSALWKEVDEVFNILKDEI